MNGWGIGHLGNSRPPPPPDKHSPGPGKRAEQIPPPFPCADLLPIAWGYTLVCEGAGGGEWVIVPEDVPSGGGLAAWKLC